MSKVITIKLTRASVKAGPFDIQDEFENIIATDVSLDTLEQGVSYYVDDSATMVTVSSTGDCKLSKTMKIETLTPLQVSTTPFIYTKQACLWRHLTNIEIHNEYYGVIKPYIIEYPFAYQYQDQILQNVKDYTRVYRYMQNGTGVFSYTDKVEINNAWFNKAILYNGQQCTGILNLVPKPQNNLKEYMSYPIFNSDSKTIIYTKSDNFYQYNTFWSIVKNRGIRLFLTSCESLSIDKIVNQENMDYSIRSFKKETLRAKDLKVRHILDDRSDIHLVSQFIITPSQISYK